jgi:hypothetical protein
VVWTPKTFSLITIGFGGPEKGLFYRTISSLPSKMHVFIIRSESSDIHGNSIPLSVYRHLSLTSEQTQQVQSAVLVLIVKDKSKTMGIKSA